jgi:hypothetical protein
MLFPLYLLYHLVSQKRINISSKTILNYDSSVFKNQAKAARQNRILGNSLFFYRFLPILRILAIMAILCILTTGLGSNPVSASVMAISAESDGKRFMKVLG